MTYRRTLRIRVLSDLHWEFLQGREEAFAMPAVPADVVVLAGDIHVGSEGLLWARQAFPDTEIVYVAGNHEFYDRVWDRVLPELRRVAKQLGVHFLDGDEVAISGVRFLGATLWTDFDLFGPLARGIAMREAGRYITDFRLIEVHRRRDGEPLAPTERQWLTPAQTVRWHAAKRHWLETALEAAAAGPTVVVTHHAPHFDSVHPRFAKDLTSAAFASDLSPLLGKAALWIHGHMHDSFDYVRQGTRVVANPRGYPRSRGGFENAAFDPALVIEVDVPEVDSDDATRGQA
jgi:Icc-related predicted phosphoesterase